GKLWIAGDGPRRYLQHLRDLTEWLGMGRDVEFFGRVSNEDKYRLMARAHALVLASAREGWGLVVTEANACGTPAVVYDVPGLRDSVRNGRTGLVVSPTPRALADGMLLLWNDGLLHKHLSTAAAIWSRSFTADRTVDSVW